ncbi:MAG TPA: serine/threonine-protein kinase [Kofleriaceae bacterium]|nr:serine/threonine-protein kinase [Kofleriaceae bacterium]
MIRSAIGPYQLVKPLGRGGMAEVHLGIAHGASGFERKVAIKTLAPELAGEPDLQRALIREAVLGGGLHHRNVVAVLGLGVDEGEYYVVLEYVDGGDLARWLDPAQPMPEPLALHVIDELALALAYLHGVRDARGLPLGVVHRDVGPANVLVSWAGDVKLADFGVAKATALADRTAAGTRKGRYCYMAPEQLAGEPVTAAADQFGLGVTLAELITGQRPFAGETPWALLEAIRGEPALGGLAPDVRAIAARAMAPAAGDRFASVGELRLAIASARRSREPAGPVELAWWLAGRAQARAAAKAAAAAKKEAAEEGQD